MPKSAYYFASRAIGGYPFVGTPDRVAEELADLSRGGIRGIAFSMVNYLDELPFFRDEVLPRLQRMGVRQELKKCFRWRRRSIKRGRHQCKAGGTS